MADFLVATDNEQTSARLCEYLASRIEESDRVFAVNSLPGGDDTDEDDVRAGKAAIDAVADLLDGEVEVHQFVRGNDPAEDVLAAAEQWNVDELVIGVRKRTPAGKVIFGSTAQDILLNATRPVVCLPKPR